MSWPSMGWEHALMKYVNNSKNVFQCPADAFPKSRYPGTDPLINNIGYDSTGLSTEFTVLLSKPVWGYKAFYTENGSLVVQVTSDDL